MVLLLRGVGCIFTEMVLLLQGSGVHLHGDGFRCRHVSRHEGRDGSAGQDLAGQYLKPWFYFSTLVVESFPTPANSTQIDFHTLMFVMTQMTAEERPEVFQTLKPL